MPFRLCFFLSLFFSANLRGQENPLPKRLVCPGVDVVSLYHMHGDSLPSYTYVATIRPKGLPFDTLDPNFSYEFRSMGYQKVLLSYAQLLALEGKVNLLPKDIELPDYTIVVPSLRLVPNTQEVLAIGRASQERRQPQTMAHWLESAGGIFVQRSQQGNQDYGYILGGHALYEMALSRHLGVAGRCNYTFGRMRSASLQSWVPMGHIAPLYGQLAVHYRRPVWEAETWVQVHGQKSAEEYSPFGEDNLRYATPGGMPAWWTLHMRWAWNINAHVRLQLTLENVLDVRYRVFASGISAPGRNFVVSVQGNF